MTEPTLHADFVDMLEALVGEGVDFLLVGAFALAAHGAPRHTGDLDVWVRADVANARRVVRALARFGAPIEAHGIGEANFASVGDVYQMGVPPVRIDLLTGVSGLDFDSAWANRVPTHLGALVVPVLGLADLITNKRASGRVKDLQDLELLREAGVEVG